MLKLLRIFKKEGFHLNLISRTMTFLHRKLDGYQLEEYMIMFVAASIFLPFYCSIVAILLVLMYLTYKKKIPSIVRQFPKAMYPIAFSVITLVVSLIYGNYLGAVCSLGIFIIFLFILFYRSMITERLFELIVDASCIVSLFCFGWALLEYSSIIQSMDYEFFQLEIADDPYFRVNSTFFNANYYAMMIEFLVLMCIYKMMNAKTLRRIVFYILTIGCNLLGLYLSGCRTAWVPFVITIPLMFLLNNKKGYFNASVCVIAIAGLAVLLVPELFPRSDSFGLYLNTRIDIWKAALEALWDTPLFGRGPLTYNHINIAYGGPPTQHAHNVFLDPLLSFGVVGVGILIGYFWENGKEVWHLYSQKLNIRLFSLILVFIITVIIHGLLDFTIFWVQTSQIFFLVLSASSIYTNGRYKELNTRVKS